MRKLTRFLAGALALLILIGAIGLVFLKTRSNGFSTRVRSTAIERAI